VLSIPNEGDPYLTQIGALSGASDLLVIHRTKQSMRIIFCEVKTPTGRQSPKQQKFEEHVINMGLEYHIVRNLEEFKNIIKNT